MIIIYIFTYVILGTIITSILERSRPLLEVDAFVFFVVMWPAVLFVSTLVCIREFILKFKK